MNHRQYTPPTIIDYDCFENLQPGGSASTDASYHLPHWHSPDSVLTTGTSRTTPPPASPPRIREIGPALLPRVRPQDGSVHALSSNAHLGHGRTLSLPTIALPMQFGTYLPGHYAQDRRSNSPPVYEDWVAAAPGCTPCDSTMLDVVPSRPSMTARSRSNSSIRSHSRNSSSTSVDPATIQQFGYPTYRVSPGPQQALHSRTAVAASAAALSHLAPIAMPNGRIQSYPSRRRTPSPPTRPSRLSVEIEAEAETEPRHDLSGPTGSIIDYLTAPNPTPSLVQRAVESNLLQKHYIWFDIRNVRPWTGFNTSTMSAIPHFLTLLNVQVELSRLPAPGRVNLHPETTAQLAEMCAKHHAVKVNAALKVAQGQQRHMVMRSLKATDEHRQRPEFVSNYEDDTEKTISGDGRGKVIGIAKCHDQWNSGMRNDSAPKQVSYLASLAQLHYFMREHGCRYAFIMTEIELVCVRAGGPPEEQLDGPQFGYMEVADAIPLSNCGFAADNRLRMTADLALWYLHMLAKDQPLEGQMHWRMDVGRPVDCTRRHHKQRDAWMPKVTKNETRAIKRLRGFVWPNEPYNRREEGKGRRK